MLSLDLLPRLRAPQGKMLGLPDHMSEVTKTGLFLPPGYLSHTRSSIVRVLHDDYGVYPTGAALLLASTAGRRFYVGYTSTEEVEVLMFPPSAILLELPDVPELGIDQKEDFRRNLDGRNQEEPDDKWDEGEPDALR